MKEIDRLTERFRYLYEKFLTGCDSLEETGDWNKDEFGEMDVYFSADLVSVILRLIAADGRITGREAEYLDRTFGFSLDAAELKDIYDSCGDDIAASFEENAGSALSCLRGINPGLADAYKELLGLVCEILPASDGVVSAEETGVIARLKALL